MAIVVNTNLTALKTQANLSKATTGVSRSLERMSTGMKINGAKDDAAGMFVATKITSQIRGSQVAQENIVTGSNLLATVEGDLDTILGHLNRIRDLAVQGANSIYDADGIGAMKSEVTARLAEIDRVANASSFNGQNMLAATGAITSLRLQVGANADTTANRIEVTGVFGNTTSAGLGVTLGTNLDTAENSANFITTIDNAIKTINTKKSTIGAVQNRLESAQEALITTIENATAARSAIMDADIAQESMEYTRQQILQQTSSSLMAQSNQLPAIALALLS